MSPEPQNNTPAPEAPAPPPKKAGQTGPGWDSPGTGATGQVAESGGLVDSMKLYWRKANEVLDTSVLSPFKDALAKEDAQGAAVIQKEIDHAHPYRAAIAQMYYGTLKDAANLALSLTTPKNLALAAATGGESAAAKAVGTGANVYFGWRGSQDLFKGRQDNETQADALQRQLLAGSQVAASGAGTGATVKDAIHDAVQNNLGLSGDLAKRVADKVAKASAIEESAAKQTQAIKGGGQAKIDSTETLGEIADKAIGQTIPERMGKIAADGSQVVHAEKARVDNLFQDLGEKATVPVTSVADMRAEIVNTLKSHGVQDAEIPQRIFNALPQNKTTVRALTASENLAAQMVANNMKGWTGEDIRSGLVNLGYVPAQVDAIMNVAAPHAVTSDVSFKGATRVRGDLYDAAQASNDPVVRRALFEAHDNVTGMQERYAEAQGFGKQYQDAKQQYSKFKRELGSGLMDEFMKASDVEDQAMLPRVSKLINPASGEALRGLLKSAGVDVSPLVDLVAERKTVAEGAADRVKELQKQTALAVKSMGSATNDAVSAIGTTDAIIKGQSDLKLAGQDTESIRQTAIKKLVNNSRVAGITNPNAYIMVTMGLAQMLAGSMFGTFKFASGGTRLGIEKALRSKSFQDWIIDESGVEKSSIPAFRASLEKAYPKLRAIAESGAFAGTLNQANQNQQQPESAPAPEPAKVQPVAPPSSAPVTPPRKAAKVVPIGIAQ